MPNQREIAKLLGVAQSTVSMALRGNPRISSSTRRLVEEAAQRAGYCPNPMVSALMSHIQSGRKVVDQGCIAILVDAASQQAWFAKSHDAYRRQYQGYQKQAELRGYRTECFFLRAPNVTPEKVDRQLHARGITGIILAAPKHPDTPPLRIRWERYACATLSYSWNFPAVDRAATHFRRLVETSFQKIQEYGYKRIGLCLPPESVEGVDSNWKAGFLLWQDHSFSKDRIPLFVGKPGVTPLKKFRSWLTKWKPEVLLCLIGLEQEWLHEMGMRVPEELGVVCLNRSQHSWFAGMDENNVTVGALVCDLVINKLLHNERGLPEEPKIILVNGMWRDGESLTKKYKRTAGNELGEEAQKC